MVESSPSPSTLIDIQEIPNPYRRIFADYHFFNRVQSRVFHDVLFNDQSIALSAPTGSGKTVIFELAIIRQLIALENSKYSNVSKIIYISPMKALCEERLIDWHKKLSQYGINCISITGDSENIDFHNLSNHNLIITTPEKWDSISRKWKENKQFIQEIKVFMIDEVHLLNEEFRGATLEALICRMKTIQSSLFDENAGSVNLKQNIRFIAVSATFPNIKDMGEWLCGAKCFSFDDSIRPVKLNTIVMGYSYSRACSPFKFDITLNYKLSGLILKYSNGKPTLIFCSTRKSVEMATKQLTQTLTIPLSASQKEVLYKAASSVSDSKLRSSIVHGIGYHHGGLLSETRSIIEQLFRAAILPVLITTSTLATGVNLPAHLVIIKSTKFYDKGGFQDYTATSLLQMIGRAGRPQFDTEATALILTTNNDKVSISSYSYIISNNRYRNCLEFSHTG
ncbi:hypothetical protein HHI36_014856 [Cryptolaemus montrouzieri]|uniref:P-loop containing nucleoside triphosphate hydrolase protein n=1 Tax=Cryptolaemus montrouzieri TaxID=559131 RepID=A0ABD2N4U4_9CUCU